jgi:hypothetical protein
VLNYRSGVKGATNFREAIVLDIEIKVAGFDPTVCGKGCGQRASCERNYCNAFRKYLQYVTKQKYKGSVYFERCAECLAYQPVDNIGDNP